MGSSSRSKAREVKHDRRNGTGMSICVCGKASGAGERFGDAGKGWIRTGGP